MQEIATEIPFSATQKILIDGHETIPQTFYVNIGTGSAVLEIQTPDGWSGVTTYTTNTIDYLKFKHIAKYRFVLTGNAKAYLIASV